MRKIILSEGLSIIICMPNLCEKKSYRTKEVYEVFNEYNKKYQQVFGSSKSKR